MARKTVVRSGKKYWTVSGVCAELGIFKNTLYNWERKGKIPKAYRDPMSGWRLYFQKDLEKIKQISGR
ncbi:MAG: hypothetical protein COX41_07195 [Candidatus Omnitrophica bacterium CG23_combo_of_CG06-09_8_20_14_all_41_10]|uniref:HTH merR-type domain-containing protein n=1 Tax=Candidatus Sherwoodlollariibacterium unditelluris TaxID=1974757 RepID=A0A2G9YHF8_9BACT|nr:MAG: hypothetical protein COX41_07195 [Candidatus Omnitrophica bacterium CG23_combo_of_CG06-09_8_20_14_all_41_10]